MPVWGDELLAGGAGLPGAGRRRQLAAVGEGDPEDRDGPLAASRHRRQRRHQGGVEVALAVAGSAGQDGERAVRRGGEAAVGAQDVARHEEDLAAPAGRRRRLQLGRVADHHQRCGNRADRRRESVRIGRGQGAARQQLDAPGLFPVRGLQRVRDRLRREAGAGQGRRDGRGGAVAGRSAAHARPQPHQLAHRPLQARLVHLAGHQRLGRRRRERRPRRPRRDTGASRRHNGKERGHAWPSQPAAPPRPGAGEGAAVGEGRQHSQLHRAIVVPRRRRRHPCTYATLAA